MNNRKDKKVKWSYQGNQKHWVGNGFYVHGLLRPTQELIPYISPFILMDYASPREFPPTSTPKGVGEHPHRGFETVTFAYQGEVEHRDSSGGGGVIGPGDVQWMTAGKGVVHDEFHSTQFSRTGGVFEMVQIWVNLPKVHKMTKPKYQGIKNEDIPKIKIGHHSTMKIIAGDYNETHGPASTFTQINIFEITSKDGDAISLSLSDISNTILLILRGDVKIKNETYQERSVLVFDRTGTLIELESSPDFMGLILNGEPIDEPMVAHGPFVMNSDEEINQAILDYQDGKMGYL